MDVVRENVKASSRVLEKSLKSNVESNVIVPDKNPDILKVLQVDATCAVAKKTLKQGRLSVEGKVFADVLYLPDCDGGGIRTLQAEFEFNDVIDCPDIGEEMHVAVLSDIEQMDVNLINSRKISLRATVGLNVEITADREISYISAVDADDAAYKCDEVELYSVIAEDSCEFLLKEQIELVQGKPAICELLKCDVAVTDKEIRTAGNKVIVKGVVCASVLYSTESCTVENADARLPFTEVFEVNELSEEDKIDARCCKIEKCCKSANDYDGAVRLIDFEFLVGIELCVRRAKRINYLSDCYFFGAETDCDYEQVETERITVYPKAVKSVRDVISCDNRMPRIATVYNVVAKPQIVSTEQVGDGLAVSAKLEVSVLYLSENSENPVCCQKAEIPVMHTLNVTAGARTSVTAECEHISYSLSGSGDVELRAAVAFTAEERILEKTQMIAGLERGETSKGNELIIFFAKGGESLWSIAKQYKVNPEEIAALNELDCDCVIESGKRLIIPSM